MAILREIRRRAWQIGPQVLAACLVAYFAFHAVQGDRGLLAYLQLKRAVAQAEAVHAELAAQRAALAHKVALLRPDSLDRDLLEERAREVLNYAHPDEAVILRRQPGARDEGRESGLPPVPETAPRAARMDSGQ